MIYSEEQEKDLEERIEINLSAPPGHRSLRDMVLSCTICGNDATYCELFTLLFAVKWNVKIELNGSDIPNYTLSTCALPLWIGHMPA